MRRLLVIAGILAACAGAQDVWSPSKIANQIAGMLVGEVVSRDLDASGRISVAEIRVGSSLIGTLPRGEVVYFGVDPENPPGVFETDDRHRPQKLIAFDSSNRLLLVSNQHEWSWLASVLMTSRRPSTRYTEEELARAWRIANGRGDVVIDPGYRSGAQRRNEMTAGRLELSFRFGSAYRKSEILRSLRAGRPLSPEEIDALQVCLWDRDPSIQTGAAQVILRAGGKLDPAAFRQPGADVLLIGPRLRAGESGALSQIRAMLEAKGKAPGDGLSAAWLLDQAAFGPPELLPLVRPFLASPHFRATFAWARLGGPAKEITELLRGGSSSLVLDELIEADTAESWKLVEASGARPTGNPGDRAAERLARLVMTGATDSAIRLVKSFGAPPKNCVEAFGPECAMIYAGSGNEAVLEELLGLSWTDRASAGASEALCRGYGDILARNPDPRVVDVLVSAIIAARAGFPGGCGHVGDEVLVDATRMLMRRPDSDRARALKLLEEAPNARIAEQDVLHLVRLALGVPPPAGVVSKLQPHVALAEGCGLSLASWAQDYSSELPALLANVEKHWFALALLRDESAIELFGNWIEDAAVLDRDGGVAVTTPATALRMIGGPKALEALYRAARRVPRWWNATDPVARAIEDLESPSNWKRLAALSTPTNDKESVIESSVLRLMAKRN